jgi:hypothetical protein
MQVKQMGKREFGDDLRMAQKELCGTSATTDRRRLLLLQLHCRC